ncbi:hypothetical protein BpHYR1_053980 [Brachionus plicatilis]|uniref:Uncharacterized protein n=1 Tax=Brachionus plicatilis TaxID=10195 RepID=A0A3M7PNE8_BRAPC|nr:hypothetical protein BpHYR1_053980 [Brachionus plicatilis]
MIEFKKGKHSAVKTKLIQIGFRFKTIGFKKKRGCNRRRSKEKEKKRKEKETFIDKFSSGPEDKFLISFES